MKWFWLFATLCSTPVWGASPPAAEPSTRTVEARVKLGAWKSNPTRTLADLDGFVAGQKPTLDRFGGWVTPERHQATGFFYAKKLDDRWWLIDPEGNRFLNVAVNSVTPGKTTGGSGDAPTFRFSERARVAFKKQFHDVTGWRTQTLSLLRDACFNGTGSWTNDAFMRGADHPIVYTPNLGWMGKYGSKRGGTYALPGHTGYPNDCIFAFDPEFAAFCDEQGKALAERKDDPYLLGYFSDNEMPFPKDSIRRFLALPDKDPGRVEAEKWVAEHNVDRTTISVEQNDEWLGHVGEAYYGVVGRAIKKYDPNHLYLGSRFYGSEKRCQPLFKNAAQFIDVISVNLYSQWTPGTETTRWSTWTDKPLLITEFYAKGDDSGMPNTEGAGYTVKTQADRGAFYQNFTLALLQTKSCVGWHWFKYIDNDLTDKGAGPSNQDANKGIVNAVYEPYDALLSSMRKLNSQIYPLSEFLDASTRRR